MSPTFVRRGRALLALAALAYGVSPVDLVPDVVPLLGFVDDLGVVGVALLAALVLLRERRPPAVALPTATTDP